MQVDDEELKKLMTKPLIKYSDMPTEMGAEAVEMVTMAVDKFQATNNYEATAQLLKTSLDRKFGPTWHCVIGEGFGFDISCQRKYLLHVYYGTVGIICYKMGS